MKDGRSSQRSVSDEGSVSYAFPGCAQRDLATVGGLPPRAAVTITGEVVAYVQDNTLFIRALDDGEAKVIPTATPGVVS